MNGYHFNYHLRIRVEIAVQLHLELEVNLLVQNVIEREIEREKVQMKPPIVAFPLTPCKHCFDMGWVTLLVDSRPDFLIEIPA